MELKCREYQTNSLDQIRDLFKQGYRRVLLWLATGAGKTFIFCLMIKKAVENNHRCIVVVRGRKLVDQASERLFREGVLHGVLMAKHWNYRPNEKVQVCSIDTLISRGLRPKADLIIIDEAHQTGSKGYKEFLSHYPDAFIVPVTATPWLEKGLRHVADKIVHPITMQQLIDEGHLNPFRYFAPSAPDMSEAKISSSTKDYVTADAEKAMIKGALTGKVIEHWRELASNRKTLLFAVNIKHSKMLAERFCEAGIPALHCDAESSDSERKDAVSKLESGEVKIICNVGIFCTGVDIPSLGCISMCRPTKSLNLFIQQAGRGTRLSPGKTDCILLDHAGNIVEHGFPTEEPECDLDGWSKKESHKKESKICKSCFAVYRGSKCPECGEKAPPEPRSVDLEESDERLKEIKPEEQDPILVAHKLLLKEARKKKRKAAWAHYRLVDRFGYEQCKHCLPQWFIDQRENPFQDSRFQPRGFSPRIGFR